ncbi:UNKNOWN [Stylonychia lemnae]|uniref:Uncharacterized protein n=1 Tax=Stylonychia lemnae TaxID=5949 RepID=A0A077ZXT0_STYLE|nr:UNKNOWN [Stylonychia lemnae]|eukprot:CDW73331.1 UNKNOWN [Stylonychia lemnae]
MAFNNKPKSLKEIFEQEIFSNQSSALKGIFQQKPYNHILASQFNANNFSLTSPQVQASDTKMAPLGMSFFKNNTNKDDTVNQFMQSIMNPGGTSMKQSQNEMLESKKRNSRHRMYKEIFGNESDLDEDLKESKKSEKQIYGGTLGANRETITNQKSTNYQMNKKSEDMTNKSSFLNRNTFDTDDLQKSQMQVHEGLKKSIINQRESRWGQGSNLRPHTLSSESRSRSSNGGKYKSSINHQNDSMTDMECQTYYQSIKGLLQEKEKVDLEEQQISQNKKLTFVDKCDAMKSARSLSKTINSLIGRQTDKISEYYDSQMREKNSMKQSIQSNNQFQFENQNNSKEFSNTLQYDSNFSNQIKEFDRQKQFNSLDYKGQNQNINVFQNQYKTQKDMEESMCSFQSRVNDEDQDIYVNELQQFSRNESQQSDANPLQRSQLHVASKTQNRYNSNNFNELNNTPSFDPQALANSTLRLQSLKNFSLGASQQLQFLQSKQTSQDKFSEIEVQFQEQLTKYNMILDQLELVTNQNQELLNQVQKSQEDVRYSQSKAEEYKRERDRVNNENMDLLERMNDYKSRTDQSIENVNIQELLRKNQLLQEEKRLLNDKIKTLELQKDSQLGEFIEQKSQDVKFIQEQYETQIKALQDQISQKDQHIEMIKNSFEQFDQKLEEFNTQAIKLEQLSRQNQEQQNTIKYLEGLLDAQQQVTSEFERSNDLERVIQDQQQQIVLKDQYLQAQNEKIEDYRLMLDQIQLEKDSLNKRLDQVLNVTQKDRVDSNLYKLEVDTYLKQIDQFKLSELNLKKQINKLKTQINGQYKEASENNDKYAKEMELNKQLQSQLQLTSSKLEEYQVQNSQLNSKLEESQLSTNALSAKLEKQKQKLQNKIIMIDDLKESVNLKITVTEDLQNLLQQSQSQYQEIKNEMKTVITEKDKLLGRYYKVENVNSQLHQMNQQLFGELDHLQQSLVQMSQNGNGNAGLQTLNPFLSHLSQLKSIYEQKFTSRDLNCKNDEELNQLLPEKQSKQSKKKKTKDHVKRISKDTGLGEQVRDSFNDTELQRAVDQNTPPNNNQNKNQQPHSLSNNMSIQSKNQLQYQARRITQNKENLRDSINMRETDNAKIFADQKMSILSLDSKADQSSSGLNKRYSQMQYSDDDSQSLMESINHKEYRVKAVDTDINIDDASSVDFFNKWVESFSTNKY